MVCCILSKNNCIFKIINFRDGYMKRKSKSRKNKSIILRLLILGVCAYFVVTLSSLWKELAASKDELNAQKELYVTSQTEIEELRALLESDDKKIIEKAARERFGYVYPNEQIFKDTSGN